MVSKYRPQADIIAATPQPKILNKLALVWGVHPVVTPETRGTDAVLDQSIRSALDSGYINNGDLVVITAGIPTGFSGGTNLLKVHIVGNILVEGMGIGKKTISGKVRIVKSSEDFDAVEPGDIVVTTGADSRFASILDRIGALVAEAGGLTSDAAIMGMNAGIPVIVGAQNATSILKDNMVVTVHTSRGRIYQGVIRAL
jgi:pyruvate kinase